MKAEYKYLTYNEANNLYAQGLMSDHNWRVYKFFWTWTAPRFCGIEACRQERAFMRLGKDAYYRRINRVRNWAGFSPL
jgi:hypothetical protein